MISNVDYCKLRRLASVLELFRQAVPSWLDCARSRDLLTLVVVFPKEFCV